METSLDNNFRYQIQAFVLLYVTRGDMGERLLSRNELRRNIQRLFGIELDEHESVVLPGLPIVDGFSDDWDELTTEDE